MVSKYNFYCYDIKLENFILLKIVDDKPIVRVIDFDPIFCKTYFPEAINNLSKNNKNLCFFYILILLYLSIVNILDDNDNICTYFEIFNSNKIFNYFLNYKLDLFKKMFTYIIKYKTKYKHLDDKDTNLLGVNLIHYNMKTDDNDKPNENVDDFINRMISYIKIIPENQCMKKKDFVDYINFQ